MSAGQSQMERELEATRRRLSEAEATLNAIREDRVDALVVAGPQGDEIRTILGMGTLADSMFNQVSQPVFILDESSRILRANRFAHDLCGGDPELKLFAEALPLHVTHPGGGPEVSRGAPPKPWTWSGEPVDALDVALVRPDGETLYFLLDARPIPIGPEWSGGVIVTMMDITRRKRDEIVIAVRNEQLRYQFQLTKSITDNAADGLILMDIENRVNFTNPSADKMLGVARDEVVGKSLPETIHFELPEGKRVERSWPFRRRLAPTEVDQRRLVLLSERGRRTTVECSLSPVVDGGVVTGSVLVMRDVSEQVEAERALLESTEKQRQSQKMEAIGRLAGGIAHDFNNLLLAMLGFTEMSIGIVEDGSKIHQNLLEIKSAGEKAAALTNQLLAYGRKQVLTPVVGRIDSVVLEIHGVLQKIAGEKVRLDVDLSSGDSCAKIDKPQLQQVLINMALNAADAMPEGGVLTVRTASQRLPAADANGLKESLRSESNESPPPGEYGVIEVRDTGHGMSEAVKAQLFEPFFTTNEFGSGSGLGLSTAYGIIRQMGGFIQVASAPGEGALFRIALPLAEGRPRRAQAPSEARQVPSGAPKGETVLLAEDEDVVRLLLARVLTESGYDVLTAPSGEEALEVAAAHDGPIDLLVTDVVMDRMGGRELAEKLVESRPGTQVVYISGYTEDEVLRDGTRQKGSEFISKPFRPAKLLRTIRDLLDRRSASHRDDLDSERSGGSAGA